ncbi:MAG: HupE/UreJ family protein [Methylomonas sp.]|nr:HupE/UreJ family protein [Methylomonas sp.]
MKGKVKCVHGYAVAALAYPWVAEAHPFHWASESIGFVGGLLHPLTSLEHLLTMLVVGLWVAQMNGRTVYAMPALFAVLMMAGVGLAVFSAEIAHADIVMASSALLLLISVCLGGRLPAYLSMPIVANLAMFHGYQHAYDIWLDADAMTYTGGFATATLILIVAGVGAGRLARWLSVKFVLGGLVKRLS